MEEVEEAISRFISNQDSEVEFTENILLLHHLGKKRYDYILCKDPGKAENYYRLIVEKNSSKECLFEQLCEEIFSFVESGYFENETQLRDHTDFIYKRYKEIYVERI